MVAGTRRIVRSDGAGDRAFDVLNTLLLVTIGLAIVIPVLNVVASSFSSSDHILAGDVTVYPRGFTLLSYERIFRYKLVLSGFLNSLFYVTAGTSLNLVLTVFLAYPLSRKDLRGLAVIGIFVLIPMFFRGGIVPTFLVVNSLGLVNSRWAVILPAGLSIWNTIVARTYFANLPQELTEASEIDGCSDLRFLAQVVLPLSRPILAVLVLWYAIDHWNTYFNALLYLFDESKFPLQLVLARILIINESIIAQAMAGGDIDIRTLMESTEILQTLKFALIVVASVPMMILYPFIQKHFAKGVMIGSIKG
ncbi:MAG: carbohydrate ABC transporter permease [Spirochaetaceae bacterium]|nr:carbohydrate ABC transporter permease [Spirochaetaceae bacterium]